MDIVGGRGSVGREPALDGLRALAVIAVLVYHEPVSWLPGGFLGVSTFFTLSGFLITRLLLAELASNGRIDVGAFYVRRFRRLAPAALLTALAIVVAWTLTGRRVRTGDVVASVADVQNWWLLHRGDGYASLFADPSPFQHFWSLAIEEQFYLVFPVLLIGLAGVVRRRPVGIAAGLGLGLALSVVVAARASTDVAYYSTVTRAAELLVGSLLAVATTSPRTAPAVERWGRSAAGRVGGLLAAAVLIALWTGTRLEGDWLFPWATLANAAATAVLVVECCSGTGLRRSFAARPVAGLGRVSYGVYLVHWPVYLLLPASAVAWEWALFPARVAITVCLAVVLFALIEEPVRTGRAVRGEAFPMAGLTVVTATLALALTVAPAPPTPLIDEAAIDAASQRLLARSAPTALPSTMPAARTPSPPTDPVAGTSSVRTTTPAPAAATTSDPPPTSVAQLVAVPAAPTPSPAAAAAAAPAPAPTPALRRVLFVGDSTSWTLEGVRAAGILQSVGGRTGSPPFAENEPARADRYNALLRSMAAVDPRIHLVDLAGFLAARPGGEFAPGLRPDGVHLDSRQFPDVVDFLVDAAYASLRTS